MRDEQSLLKHEVRRNPVVAKLYENVSNITQEEIQSARILPWIKRALTNQKAKIDFSTTMSRVMNQISPFIKDTFSSDPIGETMRWIGDDTYIRVARNNQILIKYGELFWSDGKGVWIDTVYSEVIDPKLSNNQSCGKMTRSQYMEAVRERAREQSSPSDQIIGVDQNKLSPLSKLAQYGVKIY